MRERHTPGDIAAIHEVLARYGDVVDDRRWDDLGLVFAPDAEFHVVNTDATMIGPSGIAERFSRIRHPIGHHITNTEIGEPDADGRVRVRSKFITVRSSGNAGTGVYDDVFAPGPDGWRIVARRAELVEGGGGTRSRSGRVRLAVNLPMAGQLVGEDHAGLVEVAQAVERSGVDTVIVPDHVVMGERLDRYRWGTFPFPKGSPWLDPIVLLSVIAGATSRVRLATSVLIAPLRPPVLLATMAATLDQLSRGRLELGVGTGWQPEEYEALGLSYDHRAQLLDDAIAACRALWGRSPVSFDSPTVSFADIWCDPKPVAPTGVPVLFGGPLTRRNLDRVVGLGDGWIPIMRAPLDEVLADIARIREAAAAAGRDVDALRFRVPLPVVHDAHGVLDVAATLVPVPSLADGGVTEVSVPLVALVDELDELRPRLDELAGAWRAVS